MSLVELDIRPKDAAPQGPEEKVGDPDVQLLTPEDVVKLQRNGMADGRKSKYVESVHRHSLDEHVAGGAFRRKGGVLKLELYLRGIPPDELAQRTDWGLQGEEVRDELAEPGDDALRTRVVEFLGLAPVGGRIENMIAEAPPPRSAPTFIPFEPRGTGRR